MEGKGRKGRKVNEVRVEGKKMKGRAVRKEKEDQEGNE